MTRTLARRKIDALVKAVEGIGIPFMDGGYDYIREILDEELTSEAAVESDVQILIKELEDLETRASGHA